jgi:hypothetical protein
LEVPLRAPEPGKALLSDRGHEIVSTHMRAHFRVAQNRSSIPRSRPRSYVNIFLYQIAYTKPHAPEPDFLVLDNSSNERPDWFEYWPIRRFLLNESLDEESFYGFLSPRFKQKTNLSAEAVREFISRQNEATDVILFSPSIHLTAYHLNVFAYGDACHPGLLQVATQFFKRIGEPTNLNELVTNSSNEVSSNYIVAKPRFWRAWLSVTERLFAIAESPPDPLGVELRKMTSYRDRRDVQMKIFVMERIATWILVRDPRFIVRAHNPFIARSRIYKLPVAIVCDALKIAHVSHQGEAHKDLFKDLFFFVSRFDKFVSWQIRLGNMFGSTHVRACLSSLASYWTKAGRS